MLDELVSSHTKIAIYPALMQSAAKGCDLCLTRYQVQGDTGSDLPN